MSKRLRQDSLTSEDEAAHESAASKSRSQSAEPDVHTPKYTSLEAATEKPIMRCSLPPHKPLDFPTYAEYESHYNQFHINRCRDCRKNFPTGRFLELHLAEHHDPIVASKQEAGEKTYACFVEDCEKVCGDWKKRRSHLVDKHGFPKNYDFLIVDHGIDGRSSMLRPGVDEQGHRKSSRERHRKRSSTLEATQSTEATSTMSTDEARADITNAETTKESTSIAANGKEGMDQLTSSMSSLNMVPRSITFGQRKGRSGFAKS
jgi:hypothetical protein